MDHFGSNFVSNYPVIDHDSMALLTNAMTLIAMAITEPHIQHLQDRMQDRTSYGNYNRHTYRHNHGPPRGGYQQHHTYNRNGWNDGINDAYDQQCRFSSRTPDYHPSRMHPFQQSETAAQPIPHIHKEAVTHPSAPQQVESDVQLNAHHNREPYAEPPAPQLEKKQVQPAAATQPSACQLGVQEVQHTARQPEETVAQPSVQPTAHQHEDVVAQPSANQLEK